jgi:membrane protease YdiL (CAAX protease family)
MTSAEPVTMPKHVPSLWPRLPVIVRAVIVGLLVCLPAANVITALAVGIGMSSVGAMEVVATLEVAFLLLYLWWTRGGGPPRSTKSARARACRAGSFSLRQWMWAIAAALAFAVTVHAAMVVTFRLVPFPADAFHKGYNFSQIPSLPLKLLAVVLAAASAAITEETGFRGYMQQPIEERHGALVAIVVSTAFFLIAHLNQSWAVPAMNPIGILVAVLLGLLAWSSGSLVPGILGHTTMDIGLFAFWWTGIAGTFTARTINETGIDAPFAAACAVFIAALLFVVVSISRLRALRDSA